MQLQDIINTKIVREEWDVFWREDSMHKHYEPKETLIFSQSFVLGGAEEIQLKKMMGACGIDTLNINIIQINIHERLSWHILREKVNSKYVILLGVQPSQLGIAALFRLNEPNHFDNCLFIPAVSLTDMEKMPEMKKDLWLNGLKPVFVDKTTAIGR